MLLKSGIKAGKICYTHAAMTASAAALLAFCVAELEAGTNSCADFLVRRKGTSYFAPLWLTEERLSSPQDLLHSLFARQMHAELDLIKGELRR